VALCVYSDSTQKEFEDEEIFLFQRPFKSSESNESGDDKMKLTQIAYFFCTLKFAEYILDKKSLRENPNSELKLVVDSSYNSYNFLDYDQDAQSIIFDFKIRNEKRITKCSKIKI
jgi:hypothetical protein